MAKTHQERPHRVCSLRSVVRQDEPRHKIEKHHDLKCCPIFRCRHKRSNQFNGHAKKARGLRATAEARRLERNKRKAAAPADGLKKLAETDAPASTPPTHQASSSSCTQSHHDPPTNTNTPLTPSSNFQLLMINEHDESSTQEQESFFELSHNGDQGSRRSSDTLSYPLPATPISHQFINHYGERNEDSTSAPYQSEASPPLSSLPRESDLDWERHWDLEFTPYDREALRMRFESNDALYDTSLAYLLNL